jgi:hypothetical protein
MPPTFHIPLFVFKAHTPKPTKKNIVEPTSAHNIASGGCERTQLVFRQSLICFKLLKIAFAERSKKSAKSNSPFAIELMSQKGL